MYCPDVLFNVDTYNVQCHCPDVLYNVETYNVRCHCPDVLYNVDSTYNVYNVIVQMYRKCRNIQCTTLLCRCIENVET